jgi:hypothetical protein
VIGNAIVTDHGGNPKPQHELSRPALSKTGAFMSDVQSVLGKLRSEVAECLVVSNVATDPEKRQLFARVAEHLSGLASAVQSELVTEPAKAICVPDQRPADVIPILDHKRVGALESAIIPKGATKSLRMSAWLGVALLIAGAGALVLARAEKNSSFTALEAKIEPPPAPQEDAKQAIGEFRSAEEEDKRNVLSQQLELLAARIDNLEKARAEVERSTTKRDAETQAPHKRNAVSQQLGLLAARIDNLEKAHAEVEGPATRDVEPLLAPAAKHSTEALRPSRHHRRVSSSSSYRSASSYYRRRSGWSLFGAPGIFR